jgi:hypothetical protein
MYIVIIQKLHTQQQMFFLANLTFYSICVIVYLKVAMAARAAGYMIFISPENGV